MLVRTWNVFHGNTKPPQRRAFLEEMVRLAVADAPEVVCLQELPAWSLARIGEWSGGYTVAGVVAQRPRVGPLPSTAELGRRLTALDNGRFRSAFAGQGNALLVAPGLHVAERFSLTLNARRFRAAQAEWLSLGLVARLAWAKERRALVAARIRDGARTFVAATLHATAYDADQRLADAELLRAFSYVDGLAHAGEPVVVAGDFNVTHARSRTLHDLGGAEWGFSEGASGIDHVLVRGFRIESGPARWPDERRAAHGALLSDHAPVDAVLA